MSDIHLRAVPEKNGNLSVTFPFPKNKKRIELVNSLGESSRLFTGGGRGGVLGVEMPLVLSL